MWVYYQQISNCCRPVLITDWQTDTSVTDRLVSTYDILLRQHFFVGTVVYSGSLDFDIHNSPSSVRLWHLRQWEPTRSRHGWVHIVYHALPQTKSLQLHTIDLVRTCRISSFYTVAWQLARFQLTRRIARSLGDSRASCTTVTNAHSNEQLEQEDTFPYLGSLITEDGECSTEFRTRLNRGNAIGASLQKIWKSHSIPISTKIRLMKALVWPVATYSCESWTLRKNEKSRLGAFEMKGLRKILQVSWTAEKTNE